MSAFWLREVNLQSNAARPGDADYGAKGATRGEIKAETAAKNAAKKAAGQRRADRKAAAKGGGQPTKDAQGRARGTGDKGGQFVKQGDTGSAVEDVQAQLHAPVTGQYDANTAATVIAFQKRHNLVADGIVGRQTALAMNGQFSRARAVGPGKLGPTTAPMVGRKYEGPAKPKAKSKPKGSTKRGARVGGGNLLADVRESLREDTQFEMFHPRGLGGLFTKKGGPQGPAKLPDPPKGGTAPGTPMSFIPTYDPKPLTFGKAAGGSNGARFATHKDGSKWLVKQYGGNRDRIATELLANAVYRQMGAAAPRAGRIRLHNGKDAISYPLVDGKPEEGVFKRMGPSTEVGKHFMTDALLANWDFAGLTDDNILWDKGGMPIRVDQGGTFEYRAQGQKKPYGPVPLEVVSLLEKGGQGRRASKVDAVGMRKQATSIATTLTPEKIDALVNSARFGDRAMRERIRTNLKARVDWMRRFGNGEVGLPGQGLMEAAMDVDLWRLEEALTIKKTWNELLHPRDSHGQFIDVTGKLNAGEQVKLDERTRIKKDADGTFRVVRNNSIFKGYDTPEDAVRDALDKSARSTDDDAVGGSTKFADYNAYLASKGVDAKDASKFGGKDVTKTDLVKEIARLDGAIAKAKNGDKYQQRTVKTLEARRAEANTKAASAPLGKPESSAVASSAPAATKVTKGIGVTSVDVKAEMEKMGPGDTLEYDTGVKVKKLPGGYKVGTMGPFPDLDAAAKLTAVNIQQKMAAKSGQPQEPTISNLYALTDPDVDTKFAGGTVSPLPNSSGFKVTIGGQTKDYPSAAMTSVALKGGAHNAYGVEPPSGGSSTADSVKLKQITDMGPGISNAINVDGVKVKKMSGGVFAVGNTDDDKVFPDSPAGVVAAIDKINAKPTSGAPATPPTAGAKAGDNAKVSNLAVGDKIVDAAGNNMTVFMKSADNTVKLEKEDGSKTSWLPNATLSMMGAKHASAKGPSTAPPVKPAYTGKPIKKAQGVAGLKSADGLSATLSNGKGDAVVPLSKLDVGPGDVVQQGTGTAKLTITEPYGANGGWKAKNSNGKTKLIQGGVYIAKVAKADGSPVALKDGSGASAVSAGAAQVKTMSPSEILGKLEPPKADTPTLDKLPDGALIKTLDAKLAIMKPGEDAYKGYTKALIADGSGTKVEVPNGKKPIAFSTDPDLMKAAADATAKANLAKPADAVQVAAGGGSATVKGPPPKFDGAVSGTALTSYMSALAKKGTTTAEQKQRVSSYVGSSVGFNGGLRDTKTKKSASLLKSARILDDAIDAQAPTDKPIVLVRKTTNDEWATAVVGDGIEDRGFFSTSTEMGISTGGVQGGGSGGAGAAPIEVHVLVPPGRKGIWVNAHGGGIKSEKEVILPRNGGYEVLKSEKKGGVTVLYVELL